MSTLNDIKTIRNKRDEMAMFKDLFDLYFQPMATYAYRYVNDWQAAEDITQEVFMSLWLKKDDVDFKAPIKPYLYRATYNKSINYINSFLMQHRLGQSETIDNLLNREILSYNQHDTLLLEEITAEINSCVESLPPQCKHVFQMSREENLKNKEIAERLNISEKTVEKHISKALSEIRSHLVRMDLMPALIWLITHS